jgi:eukaryotic-like serine/threonine-protein kinase
MSRSPADRNLLFGILALQMDFIGRDALVAAMNAWVLAKHRPLGEILVDQGGLTADLVADLDSLVNRHLQMHQGDSTQSLAALSSVDVARSILLEVPDAEVQDSLRLLPRTQILGTDPQRAVTIAQPSREAEESGRPLRFKILRPHAKGGLGEVFVAYDEELNREVALKEIQLREDRNPDNRHRFIMEAEITGRLEHPGIVPVYALGTYSDGRPYYAMRFIEGEDLRESIKSFHEKDKEDSDSPERRVAFRELLRRFVDVCNAIAFAHSKGVLHRDLKPENVMLGKYGETLIVDWGLAKPIGKSESTPTPSDVSLIQPQSGSGFTPTQMGSTIGTPAYMSPEQAAGRLDQLGPASDIYSLGAALYTLLTGKKSVDGDLVEVLRKVERGEIAPPRQVNPSTPEPLDAICRKAMSLKPEDRYASALDLAQDVELWLSDEPVSAWREPTRARAGRWIRKHRTLVATALATLLVAVVGLLTVAAVQTKSGRDLAAKNRELEQSNVRLADARDRAERRVDLAVGAIENFRTAVDGNLDVKNRPENEGLRKTLLQAPLAFYQKLRDDLSANADAGPETRAKLADAYYNLATIDRQIGSQPDALKAYDEAVVLLEPLLQGPSPAKAAELRTKLASVLHDRGQLQSDSKDLAAKAVDSLGRARELWEAALNEHPDDISLRVSLAGTLDGLATLESRKGNVDAALATLKQSIGVLEEGRRRDPGNLAANLRLAHEHEHTSDVLRVSRSRLPEALASAQTALKITEPLALANPGDFVCQLELCDDCVTLARIYGDQGEFEKSLELYNRRLKILEEMSVARPTHNVLKSNRIHALVDVGTAQGDLGRYSDALVSVQKARDLAAALVRDNPTNVRFKDALSTVSIEMATPLYALGRVADALATIEFSATVLEEMNRAEPENVHTLRNLAGVRYNCGLLNATLGREEASMAAYQQSLILRERLAHAHPDDPRFALDVATTLGNIAARQEVRGNLSETLASLQRASEILQKLAAAHPENAEYQNYFLRARTNVGHTLTRMNQGSEALEVLHAVQELCERMVREHPNVVLYQKDLATQFQRVAAALQQLGKLDEAATATQKATDLNDKMLKANPKDPENNDRRLELLTLQGDLARENKQPAAAMKLFRSSVKARESVSTPTPEQIYDLACTRAKLAAAAADSGSGLSPAEARAEADQAMAALRRSVAAGFNSAEKIQKDTDLESLRNRDDFKKLIQELQQPKKAAEPSKLHRP